MPSAAPTAGQRRLSLLAINLNVLCVGIGIGALVPLIALRLAERGIGATVIGLNAAMFPLAVLAVGPMLPGLLARLRTLPSICLGLAIMAITTLLLPLIPGIGAWFALRFIGGAATAIPWVASETWLNILATERDRGRIMGLYAAVLAAGFAIGPLVISAVGTAGLLPFFLAAGIVVVAALPVLLAGPVAPEMPAHHQANLLAMLRRMPLVTVCGLGGGLIDFALFAFLPIYGLAHGIDPASAVRMVSVFIGGNVLLQLPIGWLADHTSRRSTLLAVVSLTLLGAGLLPLAVGSPWSLYSLLFAWGGTTFAIYTLGLGLLGDEIPHAQLTAANVALVMAYEVGSAVGPTLAGSAIDIGGPEGLAAVIALAAAAVLVACFRIGGRPRA